MTRAEQRREQIARFASALRYRRAAFPPRPARVYESRATVRAGMCFCAACMKADPARAALKAAVAESLRAKLSTFKLDADGEVSS